MALPEQYAWLAKEPAPKMLLEALKLYGVVEGPGTKDNPTILGWAAEVGLSKSYQHDETPWCGLFMAVVAHRAGYEPPRHPLWALNWVLFGDEGGQPGLADVLTFSRQGGGHVGMYVGEDDHHYYVLGGNQGNEVSIAMKLKGRLYSCRRPKYQHGEPPNVRPIILHTRGIISDVEI